MHKIREIVSTCPDCGVNIGDVHQDGCDVARCLFTGGQLLTCDDHYCCARAAGVECPNECHDCGQDIWDGYWPGALDAARLGLWSRMVPGQGWVPCTADHPEASEDLNTLIITCKWNKETLRYER